MRKASYNTHKRILKYKILIPKNDKLTPDNTIRMVFAVF